MKKFLLILTIFKISFCMEMPMQPPPSYSETYPNQTHVINIDNSGFKKDLEKLINQRNYSEVLKKLRSPDVRTLSKDDCNELVILIKKEGRIINSSQLSKYKKLYFCFFLGTILKAVADLNLTLFFDNYKAELCSAFLAFIILNTLVFGQNLIVENSLEKQNELEIVDNEKRTVLNILNPL